MSRCAAIIRYAYRRGYRVTAEGGVVGPKGPRKLHLTPTGRTLYYKFTIRYKGKYVQVRVHQLAGYQVFGAASQRTGVLVCHINNDSTYNRLDNFKLGSTSVNQSDLCARGVASIVGRAARKRSILKMSDTEYNQRAARADALIQELA